MDQSTYDRLQAMHSLLGDIIDAERERRFAEREPPGNLRRDDAVERVFDRCGHSIGGLSCMLETEHDGDHASGSGVKWPR